MSLSNKRQGLLCATIVVPDQYVHTLFAMCKVHLICSADSSDKADAQSSTLI